MKNELLGIAEYIEQLEQRVANLEEALQQSKANEAEQEVKLMTLEARIIALEVKEPQPASEPEPQPQQDEVRQPQPELFAEPVVEPVAKPVVEPVVEPVASSPAADIRHLISLGDRFLFQRELFAQNGEQMQKTLDALNDQPTYEAAVEYVEEHFGQWDKESTAYQLFMNVLKKRY